MPSSVQARLAIQLIQPNYAKKVDQSGVRVLALAADINVVAIVLGIISLLSFFRFLYFSTRKKAARVRFCMDFKLTKLLGFQ